MKRSLFFILSLMSCIASFSQTGQLSIGRISQMPDLPAPLQIRSWDTVAKDYDSFAFDMTKTGQYLPLARFGTLGQFNYADNIPLFLDTYVGTIHHHNQAEAINILPAIIGSSLAGIDKSNQNGQNWVSKARDFYNLLNSQDVYLNNYSTTSGSDWWYDLMPNVYFYQLRFLYPDVVPEFNTQFTRVADRWLWAVRQLGGSTTPWSVPGMNYRAFNLATGQPLTTGVPEPESAGSIAWLLYNAYVETGSRSYLEGAQLAMDFLDGWESNPSYELQLPYGTLAAARMNALEGTNYPLQKFLDWCFDRGALRGWGSIVGTWGGYDVSGLIGEANDAGNDYAFVMNGFQQAAALAPLPKYDKRYSRAIGKWMLNLANASRLFYWNALPPEKQDSYAWASQNDPKACLPYESMKQTWGGKTPFATGDAIRGGWAATNLSLYSGSSVGYLAAAVNLTNVPGILQIDLNKTDFYGDNALPGYLYFNPSATAQTVEISLPAGTFGMYEAITETVSGSPSSGTTQITIPSGEARLVRFYTWGLSPVAEDGKLYAGEDILDYHYQYDYSVELRIKALSVDQNPVTVQSTLHAYCEPDNLPPGSQVLCEWFLDDVPVTGQSGTAAGIIAPAVAGLHILRCVVSSNGEIAEDTLHLHVVNYIPKPPVVKGIDAEYAYTVCGRTNTFTARVEQMPGEVLTFLWSTDTGSLGQTNGQTVDWLAPQESTVGTVSVIVTNQDSLSTMVTTHVLVKDTTLAEELPLIWYSFDSNSRNLISDNFHAIVSGAIRTEDSRGMSNLAYRFVNSSDIIYTGNTNELNFEDAVSLSCWLRCDMLGSERFVISHGSWQQRYKLSVTPEGFLRWTVRTDKGVSDLDGSAPIELNRYYHVTCVYTGYSLELYVDGLLDSFKPFSGKVLHSTMPLTLGRMNNIETQYAFRGSLDEFRLWNREITPVQVEKLQSIWATPAGIVQILDQASVFPIPATDHLIIIPSSGQNISNISLVKPDGREIVAYTIDQGGERIEVPVTGLPSGLYLLNLRYEDGRHQCSRVVIN